MDKVINDLLDKDQKMAMYLKENSYWYKYLNRNSDNYKFFLNAMKEKYHLRVSDKINEAIDNIDLVSTILENLR